MHEHYMRRTLSLAADALREGELPIAALVVLDDRVFSEATTGERREGRLLAHAELLALDAADRAQPSPGLRRDMILYTNLEPCLMCLGAAMSFHVGAICFALESPSDGAVALADGWARDEDAMPGYQLPAIVGGILREESRTLFRRYVDLHPEGGPLTAWAHSLARLS